MRQIGLSVLLASLAVVMTLAGPGAAQAADTVRIGIDGRMIELEVKDDQATVLKLGRVNW